MWLLRVGLLVSSAVIGGSLLSGCRRRQEESTPPPETTIHPTPLPTGSYSPPRPRIGPPTETASPPTTTAPVPPPIISVVEPPCTFFERPALEVNIQLPRSELEILQNRVIPRMNIHAAESRQGNFSSILQDTELSSALASLQGVRIYLREGSELALDTESDLMNLNAAFAHLQALSAVQPDSDAFSARLREAWDNNRVTVILRGYNFQDSRVPHSSSATTELGGPFNRFRIITHQNHENYPDMVRCRPFSSEGDGSRNYYGAVSSYTIRGSRP